MAENKLDGKEKIAIISQIDDLKRSQESSYRLGKIDAVVRLSKEIIQLAEQINVTLIISEQKEYVTRVKKEMYNKQKTRIKKPDIVFLSDHLMQKFDDLLEIDKVKEAHALVEEFKEKYEFHYNLLAYPSAKYCLEKNIEIWNGFLVEQDNKVEKLEILEDQFFQAIMINNTDNANRIIDSAWDYIFKLEGEKKEIYQKKWGTLEHNMIQKLKFEEYEKIQIYMLRVEKTMKNAMQLKNDFQFDEAIEILKAELGFIQSKGLIRQKADIEGLIKEIEEDKDKISLIGKEIMELEKKLEQKIKEENILDAITVCEEIIQTAHGIGKQDLEQKYNLILKDLKQEIEDLKLANQKKLEEKKKLEALKKNVTKLNKEGLTALNKKNITGAIGKFNEIKTLIQKQMEEYGTSS